ncbi:hypothetical protein Pcinc_032474 [Petrolisthes cinctipes]|uniref:Uncharacterized protein n=1 Tax=Petrolisthes cinctipes TaxID=88211 RepID=A0AAE1K0R8_PETCI|nr:hypothetical protein Pcinc_032474 [Petrolisthes cinctipes]
MEGRVRGLKEVKVKVKTQLSTHGRDKALLLKNFISIHCHFLCRVVESSFKRGIINLHILMATVFIHPSFHPSTATVQASLVTVCTSKEDLNQHYKKEAKED